MPKLFFIGLSFPKKDFEDPLSIKGFEIFKFRSIDNALPRINDSINAIIIEKEQYKNPSFKNFVKISDEIPKIIISSDYSSKGLSLWLKTPLSYPLYNPSKNELVRHVKFILKQNSINLENKELKKDLYIAKKEISFFEEVGKILTSSKNLNTILVTIMNKTKDMVGAEAWSVFLIDEETGDLVFEQAESNKKTSKMEKYRLKQGEGIAGWVAKEGIPLIVPNVAEDSRFSPEIDRKIHFKTKSLMCVPIRSKDKMIGVLEVVNKADDKTFIQDDLNLLMRLIDQAALTLEKTSLYHKMEELVITDDLTKLFNTRYLNRTLDMETHRSDRYRTSTSLIFIDIDYFKHINDGHGHLVGSKILVEMGQLIIKNLRSIDIVARYGGDEFVVVLPQTSPKHAAQTAERIRASVEQNVFLKKEGYSFKMTASFGVASYPESAKTKEDLLRLADEAMYRVKYTTRNGVYAIS
ncbi:MAG: sensor domain-containing diguanylate cyclase [Nitrospiraceae bacterium]|nr:sensor domain-containing diguanylate cyclase [Nitrospiraceae bacterium]